VPKRKPIDLAAALAPATPPKVLYTLRVDASLPAAIKAIADTLGKPERTVANDLLAAAVAQARESLKV
jgi:hypothetical protein